MAHVIADAEMVPVRRARVTVSVILPTYNRAHVIGEALGSALAQTFDDLEVIVVDDGSSDETRQRVAAVHDRRVRYLRQPNAGVSAARNRGIAAASGELVAFLDSDDLWKSDKLQHDVAFLRRHPEADAVFADLEKWDGRTFVPSFVRESPAFAAVLAARRPEATPETGMVLGRREMCLCLLREVPIMPSAFTIRRQAFVATGPFNERWSSWEDWEFFLRFARHHRFGYIDRPLTVLRISTDSLHRVDAERGRATMLGLLLRERHRLEADREALAAVTAGIVGLRLHMGWEYLRRRRRFAAVRNYLEGFRETGDVTLLLRAIGAAVPLGTRTRARRLLLGANGHEHRAGVQVNGNGTPRSAGLPDPAR
jgi:glycosyltransferase involved in cell wall biosynthesis